MARPKKKGPDADEALDASIPGLPDSLVNLIDPALPKTSQVYGIMRRAIVNLHLAPGSSVNEKLICDQLGTIAWANRRVPLRRAIAAIAAITAIKPIAPFTRRLAGQNVTRADA